MSEFGLSLLWYFVIGISVLFYVILDGFDLGVGMLHLFARKDEERRIFLNAIGPVWDGNEVWLVIVAGALFAGFPAAYATLFSGFYNLCMLLLAGLILRAVSIEFRSKTNARYWRIVWDWMFAGASFVIAFGIGTVMGNLIEGLPLNEDHDFSGDLSLIFRPYPILIGFFTIALLMMHGSIYLALKTEGNLHKHVRRIAHGSTLFFLAMYVLTTVITWFNSPHMIVNIQLYPVLSVIAIAAFLAILNIPREFRYNRDGRAFISSAVAITFLFGLYGIGTYPYLIRSTVNQEQNSLTFFNASASPLTLRVLLIIVAIGVPLVLAYGSMVYRIFKGKVRLGPTSY